MLRYHDFLITIHAEQDGQHAVTVYSPVGNETGTFRMPLGESKDLAHRLDVLRRYASQRVSRGVRFQSRVESESLDPEKLGDLLFQSVLQGKTLELFDRSSLFALQEDTGLRIKLRIDPSEPSLVGLSALPWELMFRKSTSEHLCLSNRSPVARYLEVARPCPALPFRPPFRILVVISSPGGVTPLDLELEKNSIRQTWGQRTDVEVDFLEVATKSRLQTQLGEHDYHALHYMGHGDFDTKSGQGVLILEDEQGNADPITGKTLGKLLTDEPTLRLVFLNACNTAQMTDDVDQNPFSGVASALVLSGLPVVVAMQFPISDKAAISFSRKFYELLPLCHPVDWVVAEARKQVFIEQEKEQGTEWATPALFMRSDSGIVFESTFGRKPLAEAQESDFSRLRTKVKRTWVEGKLDKDIPIKPPITLTKELAPDALQRTFGGNNRNQEVPAGKTIATVFDENERSLLILGEPGYGKSTSMLALAQYLIRLCERDASQPIPVVLFLSTWSKSGLPIEAWAAEEVLDKYRISDVMFRQWLSEGRIVLLLDGLDNVAVDQREKCIEAINQFAKQQISQTSFSGVAVCCRFDEYQQSSARLDVEGAILLRPLSEQQIHDYLEKFGEVMAGLRKYLEEDPRLLEDARSPLMLGMMSIAYSMTPERFPDLTDTTKGHPATHTDSRKQIMVWTYLDRVFGGAKSQAGEHKKQPYSRSRIMSGLAWIAGRLEQQHQTVFQIENIQPAWLRSNRQRLGFCVLYSIAIGAIIGAILTIVWAVSNTVDEALEITRDSDRYLIALATIWILMVTVADVFGWFGRKQPPLSGRSPSNSASRKPLMASIVRRLVILFTVWMAIWFLTAMVVNGPTGNWIDWMRHTLTGGISVSVLYGLRSRGPGERFTGTTEMLRWNWTRAWRGLGYGLFTGCLIWVVYCLSYLGTSFDLAILSRNLFFYPPLGSVVGFLFGGLKKAPVTTKTQPNEGVALSLRNALIAMVVVGFAIGLSLIPMLMAAYPAPENNFLDKWYPSMLQGCAAGLVSFLWFGGIDVIRHYCLRATLFLSGQLPWKIAGFCNQMSDLILLQRVGGGYIFRNHLLRDYFASMADVESKTGSSESDAVESTGT